MVCLIRFSFLRGDYFSLPMSSVLKTFMLCILSRGVLVCLGVVLSGRVNLVLVIPSWPEVKIHVKFLKRKLIDQVDQSMNPSLIRKLLSW